MGALCGCSKPSPEPPASFQQVSSASRAAEAVPHEQVLRPAAEVLEFGFDFGGQVREFSKEKPLQEKRGTRGKFRAVIKSREQGQKLRRFCFFECQNKGNDVIYGQGFGNIEPVPGMADTYVAVGEMQIPVDPGEYHVIVTDRRIEYDRRTLIVE